MQCSSQLRPVVWQVYTTESSLFMSRSNRSRFIGVSHPNTKNINSNERFSKCNSIISIIYVYLQTWRGSRFLRMRKSSVQLVASLPRRRRVCVATEVLHTLESRSKYDVIGWFLNVLEWIQRIQYGNKNTWAIPFLMYRIIARILQISRSWPGMTSLGLIRVKSNKVRLTRCPGRGWMIQGHFSDPVNTEKLCACSSV